MDPWDGHKHTTGTKGSRMAEFQLIMIRVLNDLQVAQVSSVIRSNRCLTAREVAEECDISLGSCHNVLTK
jgi:DNA-directed RNA polymerase specialized sigma24 family protein